MYVLLVLLRVLVNLLVDVTYASLDPLIREQLPVCPTARGAIARESFYEHTASPQAPRCESSRVAARRPDGWRDAVHLAPGPWPGGVGAPTRSTRRGRQVLCVRS